MVSVKGMIIHCSLLIPEISEAVFQCLVCGYFSDPINVDRERESLDNAVVSCSLIILSSQNEGDRSASICRFTGSKTYRL
ncbi:hypothetical protein GIB67_032299 [Kingdonia uniflora]|uniref:Uncharacterized protein n=1 Tax=Kingdonia uniflora TaxID=39325 RepID=A0A7J7MXV7_9MAGN|nr:hypothetical protein GIB67_032299 [Kingdonia uniflora]